MIPAHTRTFLQRIQSLNDDAISNMRSFVGDKTHAQLANEYEVNSGKAVVDLGLNLFVLISEVYHQENFHSDILKVLLDPQGPHNEGDKYLRLFLEYIKKRYPALDINPIYYKNATVVREQGRVDLLLLNPAAKRAIIIENKLYDAVDQPKQLPRYLDYVEKLGYACDAIVYLRLSRLQEPDKTGWTEEECNVINGKLAIIIAYADSTEDLVQGWIDRCIKVTTHVDALLVLRQYGTLLKKLGGEIMNKPLMEDFYAIMLHENEFKAARSLNAMFEDVVAYRTERIVDAFRSQFAPFKKVWSYKDYIVVFDHLSWEGADIAIDVVVDTEHYSFEFFDRNYEGEGDDVAKVILDQMDAGNDYTMVDHRYKRTFAFPLQENELYQHITNFKEKLGSVMKINA